MKSAKQKREELKARREKQEKKRALKKRLTVVQRPGNIAPVNPNALAPSNSYSPLPLFYVDKPFTCKDCGKAEVWTATQQKWWYEVAKGNIDSTAIRCRPCRRKEQQRKAEARRVHLQGKEKKQRLQHKKTLP
jgi:hypothetical protein